MKKVVTMFVALCLILSLYSGAAFAEEKKTELAEDSKSAILIERDTGTVLYEKNKDEKYSPASMTKIMTMLLIMEAIDSGKIKMDEKVTTSEYAASMGGSQIFLEPGEEMMVKELLLAMAIGSANDASVALAEKIAGSEEAFVEMMNDRVKELGLKNTHFKNTTGLPVEDHYSTANDMALMAKELLKHEEITDFTKNYESYLREDTDKKFWLVNTNKLVKFYPGVDGLKTGFTSEAKYCLTATAKKDGMRVIAVVFGAPTSKSRNAQITKMLDYSFSQYATHPLYEKGKALEKAKVSKGDKKYIEAETGESVSVLTKKGEKLDKLTEEIELIEHIKAPLKKGEKIGVLKVKKDGKELVEVPLVAKGNIKKASWWHLYKRAFGMFTKTD
ncbi:D-alanyl-D-alanine carboxypeptidase family protein [Bacillus sp. SD088]|uniref:D-alanyl-D-alanine carboxypeptidase family protein n=1 Tax=Bacillus sp. SD088 TaxID=2782012 RepID=UPI001A970271|nr:D-alanyl-D-alanine carboxypeptidase family protein [Bacillus sp. SD088]MBO0995325.1 D-alanyl-D-alanine carboxypeptidase [Bacillus sp. SD088]